MLKISILNHFPILLSLHHKLVRKIIRQRLVVLGITALFTELGQLHIHSKEDNPTKTSRLRYYSTFYRAGATAHTHDREEGCWFESRHSKTSHSVCTNMKYFHPSSLARVCALAPPWYKSLKVLYSEKTIRLCRSVYRYFMVCFFSLSLIFYSIINFRISKNSNFWKLKMWALFIPASAYCRQNDFFRSLLEDYHFARLQITEPHY